MVDAGRAVETDIDAGGSPLPPAPAVDAASATDDADASLPGWKLVWSDEFNGTALDTSVWNATPDGHGGYNQELQYFNGPDTATVAGGQLHIAALTIPAAARDAGGALTCWYGPCQYSSAQLDTIGKFSHQYGRFAARIKIPAGRPFWPAFWMLGNSGGWPGGGEIDVMENVGMTPATVYGTIHGPDTGGAAYAKGGTYKSPSGDLSGDYHVYAVEWSATQIKWYLDDEAYFTVGPSDLDAGDQWVWGQQPFYLLLDLAIGGNWPGDPDGGIPEPSEMTVDWVRVYDPD
jgi:beta-glucanase (GH16 family)